MKPFIIAFTISSYILVMYQLCSMERDIKEVLTILQEAK